MQAQVNSCAHSYESKDSDDGAINSYNKNQENALFTFNLFQ